MMWHSHALKKTLITRLFPEELKFWREDDAELKSSRDSSNTFQKGRDVQTSNFFLLMDTLSITYAFHKGA